jgi:hypothetical protein
MKHQPQNTLARGRARRSAFFQEIDFPKKDFTSFDEVTKETIHEARSLKICDSPALLLPAAASCADY